MGEYDIILIGRNYVTGDYQEDSITINVVDNSTILGIWGAHLLGVWDAIVGTVKGIWQVVSHLVQTITSIPKAAEYLLKSVVPGTEENKMLGKVLWDTIADIEDNTLKENVRLRGRIAGEIAIAILATKGIDKGTQIIKSSAQSSKFGKGVSAIAKGETKADDVVIWLNKGADLFIDGGQVTYASIFANASEFAKKSADDIANMLRSAGYKGVYVDGSVEAGSLAKRVIVSQPDKNHNIAQILVSPGSVRHGNVPYIKISTNDIGIIKVVDGSPSQYISAGETGRSIIFLKP